MATFSKQNIFNVPISGTVESCSRCHLQTDRHGNSLTIFLCDGHANEKECKHKRGICQPCCLKIPLEVGNFFKCDLCEMETLLTTMLFDSDVPRKDIKNMIQIITNVFDGDDRKLRASNPAIKRLRSHKITSRILRLLGYVAQAPYDKDQVWTMLSNARPDKQFITTIRTFIDESPGLPTLKLRY